MSDDTPQTWTDDEVREWWHRRGGGFHGPKVEHAYMEEARFLLLMRGMLSEGDDLRSQVATHEAGKRVLAEEILDLRAEVQRLTKERTEMDQTIKRELELLATERGTMEGDLDAARQRIEHLEAALRWYGEKAKRCNMTTSDGDEARQALACDYGEMADRALSPTTDDLEQPDGC